MKALALIPRCDVSVRRATLEDVPFIDRLQNEHRKNVGFLARSWIENKIEAGQVLLATDNSQLATPLGYVISQDKYLKREELGLIVQLCVESGAQRKLIGATLLKAAFDRAAYGCLLFCCWCAQDIEANRFWESMGFVPLAYRGGSEKKGRVHIFWQKRVREGDTDTRWWYPTETTGGAMGAARIVLPIPPGNHWSDELPLILPGQDAAQKRIAGPRKAHAPKAPIKPGPLCGGLCFAPAGLVVAPVKNERAKPANRACPERSRRKNDPKLVAAARELRDRWLEHVNGAGGAGEMLLEGAGKYDVSRQLQAFPADAKQALLPSAA